jgi:hypothetical protein
VFKSEKTPVDPETIVDGLPLSCKSELWAHLHRKARTAGGRHRKQRRAAFTVASHRRLARLRCGCCSGTARRWPTRRWPVSAVVAVQLTDSALIREGTRAFTVRRAGRCSAAPGEGNAAHRLRGARGRSQVLMNAPLFRMCNDPAFINSVALCLKSSTYAKPSPHRRRARPSLSACP